MCKFAFSKHTHSLIPMFTHVWEFLLGRKRKYIGKGPKGLRWHTQPGWFQKALLAEGPNVRELMTVSRGTTRDHAETQGEEQWSCFHPKDGCRPGKRESCTEEYSFNRSSDLSWGRQPEQGWRGVVFRRINTCSRFSSSLQSPVEPLQWPEPTGSQRAQEPCWYGL